MKYLRQLLEWLLSLLPPDPDKVSMLSMPPTVARSSKWAKVREAHLVLQPCCQVCGSTKFVQVHHIQPFHEHPELELDPNNLITLCEGGHHYNCHLMFGHLLLWASHNPNVVEDAKEWSKKVKHRPD